MTEMIRERKSGEVISRQLLFPSAKRIRDEYCQKSKSKNKNRGPSVKTYGPVKELNFSNPKIRSQLLRIINSGWRHASVQLGRITDP